MGDHATIRSPERIATLRRTGLLDSPPEPAFDRLTRLASRLLDVPVSLVSLVDEGRQFFKSAVGLPEPWASCRETPLSHSFCRHVVAGGKPLIVADARRDEVVRENLAIRDLGVVAYLGIPLVTDEGHVLGSFCAIDGSPRDWSDAEIEALTELAELAKTEIVLRLEVAERRAAERSFRALFESSVEPRFLIDGDRILDRNKAAWEMAGAAAGEMSPATLGASLIAAGRPAAEDFAARIAEAHRQGRAAFQGAFTRPDGASVPLEICLTRLEMLGRPVILVDCHDLSDRRRAVEALTAAKELAESANRAKTEFLANMSHEVRTPMGAILGYADLLLDPNLRPDSRPEALQAIRSNGRHLLEIIDDILDLSKVEAGKVDLEWMEYSPRQILVELDSAIQVRAEEKGIRFTASALGPVPDRVRIDPTRARQILMNLAGNAIKFTDPGRRVDVRLRAEALPGGDGATLIYEVEDEGVGMAGEQLGRIFRPFTQGDSSTTRRYGGTGLGLSISRSLAEAMGGTLCAESQPGRGSRFLFRLPVACGQPEDAWTEAAPTAATAEPGEGQEPAAPAGAALAGRILVADDNADNQKILSHYLVQAGLTVEIAENGRVAVDRASRARYDLILMDMQMPELDGYGATSALRQDGYDGPILAVTAHAMSGDREKCLRVGCSDYLTKPVDPQRLLAAVARLLPGRADGRGAPTPPVAAPPADPAPAVLRREYARSLPAKLAELRAGAASGDPTALAEHAHKMRGVAGMYGLPELGEIAGLIEDAANERQDPELIGELIDELGEKIAALG